MIAVTFIGRDLGELITRALSTGRGVPVRGIRINGVWRLEYLA